MRRRWPCPASASHSVLPSKTASSVVECSAVGEKQMKRFGLLQRVVRGGLAEQLHDVANVFRNVLHGFPIGAQADEILN